MSIKQARIEGGKAFREQWGPSLLVLLLALAAVIAASVAVFGVGGLIISGPAYVGVYYVYYQGAQGNKMDWKDMIYGLKTNFGEIVLGYLIKVAFMLGIVVVAYSLIAAFGFLTIAVPILGIILIFLVTVAAVVALIIFGLYLAAVEYILAREPEIKGWEAVKKSKRIMSGNTGRFFGFFMSFIGWFILTCIFFPLALFTLPYYYMAKTVFLGSIYEEAERKAQEPVYAAPAAPAAASEQKPVKFCKHCGSPLPMEAAFCSKCGGSQITEAPQEEVKEAEAEVQEAVEEVKETAAETVEEVKAEAAEAVEAVKEEAAEAVETVSEEAVPEAADNTEELS